MNAVTEPVMEVVMDQGVYRFGEKSLHPEATCREIPDDLSLFVGQNEQSDDIIMHVLRFHGSEPQGSEPPDLSEALRFPGVLTDGPQAS